MLSATAIVLSDSPRVGRPEILASLVVINSPVTHVLSMPMDVRAVFLPPSLFGVSVVI